MKNYHYWKFNSIETDSDNELMCQNKLLFGMSSILTYYGYNLSKERK